MAHSGLSDPEHINWISVGEAIRITRDGLVTIVQNAVDKYHTWLIQNFRTYVWRDQLKRDYKPNTDGSKDETRICWENSNARMWFTPGASWEIAKIFMAPLGWRKNRIVNAKTTDILGLLNVLEWSPVLNPDRDKVIKARQTRNTWAHAPQLCISDDGKAKAFKHFISLLQDLNLRHDAHVRAAITELQKVRQDRLTVTGKKELELIVELESQLAQDVVSLDSEVTQWKNQVDANSSEIQTLKESLKKFVETNKLEKDFEAMKERKEKFENETIQNFQSIYKRLDKLEEEKSTSKPEQSVCDGKSPIKFNPVPDRMKEEFVGRDWLFRDIDSWLEKDLGPRESRAYSIRGGPGTGKSSIARELVRRQEGKKLAGHHFFQRDNPRTCDLESLVDNLSLMLSKSFPEYAALITYSYLQEAKKFRNVPEKLFDDLITTPVQRLQGSTTHFLLISALDEGGDMIASCFARLSGVLPSWLRVIFTARNNASALFNLFPGCNYANLDLDTSNPQATNRANRHNRRNLQEDMRTFVTRKHTKLKTENRDNIPHFFQNDPGSAITKIVKQSRCNFLFAKLVMEHIFTYQSEFVVLPPTLSEMYCLDFRRLIPDKKFFENKVAPVLEVVLAIEHADIKIIKLIKTRVVPWLWDQFKSSGSYLKRVVEMELLPGITTRDLNNALKLLSVYLCEDSLGVFRFSHVSVEMWLQEEKSDFFCDVNKGHSIMAKFHLKILEMRREDPKPSLHCYFYHSSFLPEPRSMDVNFFVSDLNIGATDLLAVAFLHLTIPEDFVMKELDETHVLVTMSTEEKAEYLVYAIIRNFERVAAKLICSAYWIFTDAVQYHLNSSKLMTSQHFLKKIESLDFLPQLLFSALCNKIEIFKKMIEFCVEHEVTADVCVPNFFKNTEQFDKDTCWNEDTQEYFRKLKSGEKNVITLDSLKENTSSPEEAQINDYTLEVIEKPIAEVERLVKEGECYVCFTYGWHVMALSRIDQKDLELIEYLLKHGADVNNSGHLGKTALMMACEKQNIDLASFLLNHGADVEQRDFYGSTALHHALKRNEDWEMEPISPTQERIIEMLLEHGADPRSKNSRDDSAIDIAEREGGNVLEILTRKRRRRDGPETGPDASI